MTKKISQVLTALLFGVLFYAQPAAAQSPDCVMQGVFTATGRQGGSAATPTTGFNNKGVGCTTWWLNITSTGFSAETVALQSAPDSTGVAGVWADFAGTIVSGTNPSTATTQTSINATGFYPWVSVYASALTGSGTVTYTLYGWKGAPAGGAVTGTVAATQSGTWNITNVSGTVSLPTGASTETTLAAINTSIGSITDAACTAGSTGSVQCKLRLETSQLDAIKTAVESTSPVATQPASATAPVNTMNSSTANSGLNAALAGLCDDTSPTAITENSFGFVRMNCTTHSLNVNSTPQVATSGGATPGSWISDNSSTSFVIKASAGQLYALDITNKLAAVMYVRAYNTTTATCTSATGIVGRWIIPAQTTGAGGTFHIPIQGYAFGTGISICATTTVSDTDNTAIAANSAVATYGFN